MDVKDDDREADWKLTYNFKTCDRVSAIYYT